MSDFADLDDLYQEVLLDHGRRPRNYGRLEEANRLAHGNNPLCGDRFVVYAIVDDEGVVRSVAVNDTQVGRSPNEVLRTVQAFQSGGLCGADWGKGDDFVG